MCETDCSATYIVSYDNFLMLDILFYDSISIQHRGGTRGGKTLFLHLGTKES